MNDSLWQRGVNATRQRRALLMLFLAATICALPASLTLFGQADAAFGRSAAGNVIVENTQPRAGFYVLDFLHYYKPGIAVGAAIAIGALLTFILQLVLSGGVLDASQRAEQQSWREFFGAARRQFGFHFQIVLMFGVLFLGLAFAAAALLALLKRTAPGFAAAGTIVFVGLIALTLFLRVMSDCARALVQIEPAVSTLNAWKAGGGAVLRQPLRSLGLVAFPLLIGALIIGALTALEWAVDARSAATIAIVFLIGQLAIIVRCAMRLGTWGATLAFVERYVDREKLLVLLPPMPAPIIEEPLIDVPSPS